MGQWGQGQAKVGHVPGPPVLLGVFCVVFQDRFVSLIAGLRMDSRSQTI